MEKVVGMKQRVRGAKFQEHYNQAQLFYNSLTPWEKEHMINAFVFELSHCDDQRVYERYTTILNNVDFELAKTVAQKVNGIVPTNPARQNHGKSSAPLSQLYYAPKTPSIMTRRIAILVADGFHETEVLAVRAMFASAKATTWIIGPRRAKIASAGGGSLVADHSFEDQRSTLFDAFYIPSGAEHARTLLGTGRAIHWIREAFGHCKAIGAVGEGPYTISYTVWANRY